MGDGRYMCYRLVCISIEDYRNICVSKTHLYVWYGLPIKRLFYEIQTDIHYIIYYSANQLPFCT
jgi:hypothetical protein